MLSDRQPITHLVDLQKNQICHLYSDTYCLELRFTYIIEGMRDVSMAYVGVNSKIAMTFITQNFV